MLTINNRKFARNDDEFTSSLFADGGTCSGFYKRTKRTIKLYNMRRELFACAVNNRHGERFIVSASIQANGKPWVMYGLADKDAAFLGFDKLRFVDQCDIARALFD